MSRGAIILGDLESRLSMLSVACEKCGRSGRYRLAGLIERHGREISLPDLAAYISANCPKRANQQWTDQCQALFTNVPRDR